MTMGVQVRSRLFLLILGSVFAATVVAQDPAPVEDTADESATAGKSVAVDSANEPDLSLEAIVRKMREQAEADLQQLQQREQRYQQRLEAAKARLRQATETVAAREAEGRRLEQAFDANKVELSDKSQLLKDKIGALKELFGVFQQNASDLIGAFIASPTSIQYPDRDVWLEGFANRMKDASEVSSTADIRTLWYEVMREITARGEIVHLQVPVADGKGGSSERGVARVGGFNLISNDPAPAYLDWNPGKQRVEEIPRQPAGPYRDEISAFMAADEGLHMLSVDPSGGALVALLAEKPTTRERADQGGLVGYMILGLGAIAFVLAVLKLLDIGIISLRVASQQRHMDRPGAGNALGRLLQVYADNRQHDTEVLEMRLHDRVAKESDRIRRFTVFLAIIAAVAPLMGLLGTVVGMINTFQAITLYGTGDPQTMAGGISQALITTVLGLVVAVPAVLLNAVVSARSRSVINLLQRQMALLLGQSIEEQAHGDTHAEQQALPAAPQPA